MCDLALFGKKGPDALDGYLGLDVGGELVVNLL
jgi:hypothetical protein